MTNTTNRIRNRRQFFAALEEMGFERDGDDSRSWVSGNIDLYVHGNRAEITVWNPPRYRNGRRLFPTVRVQTSGFGYNDILSTLAAC